MISREMKTGGAIGIKSHRLMLISNWYHQKRLLYKMKNIKIKLIIKIIEFAGLVIKFQIL